MPPPRSHHPRHRSRRPAAARSPRSHDPRRRPAATPSPRSHAPRSSGVPMEGEGGGVEDGRGRRSPVLLCPLPLSAGSKKHQLPHLHPISSPTSATPRRARGAESRKHDVGCSGVRRARPVVFSLQGRIRPNHHATSSTAYLFRFRYTSRCSHTSSSFSVIHIVALGHCIITNTEHQRQEPSGEQGQ